MKSLLEQLSAIVSEGKREAERVIERAESNYRLNLQTRELVIPSRDSNWYDRRDLRRHRVGGVREVRPDEDFKMAVAAAPVIPTLADRPTPGPPARKADRHADAGGQGGIQRVEQRGHADRHPVQPALAIVLLHRLIPSENRPLDDGLGHRPCLVANSGG